MLAFQLKYDNRKSAHYRRRRARIRHTTSKNYSSTSIASLRAAHEDRASSPRALASDPPVRTLQFLDIHITRRRCLSLCATIARVVRPRRADIFPLRPWPSRLRRFAGPRPRGAVRPRRATGTRSGRRQLGARHLYVI